MNVEYSHNSLPQASDKIPSHFSTITAYQKWRADIEPTIEKMKHDIFPGRDAGYHDYGYYDLGVPSPPPPRFSSSSFTAWYSGRIQHFLLTHFHPMPILLKQDRYFLEYKLYQIKKYIDMVQPFIKDCMVDDMNVILDGLAWREKVYEILRENFPGLPLEYTEDPEKQWPYLFCGFSCLFVIPFPHLLRNLELLTGLNLSEAFNVIPLALVPSFAKLAALGPELLVLSLRLSYCFYLTFITAILWYANPPVDIRYATSKAHKTISLVFIVSLCIIIPNYLYPQVLIVLLMKTSFSVFFIQSFGVLGGSFAGLVLGTLAFKLKQRFENNKSTE